MKESIYNLLTRLLEGSGLTPDDLLWGVLAGALVLAVIHLLTMLVTRWGDHRATGKALFFSLAVHTSIMTYLAFLLQLQTPDQVAAAEQHVQKTRVRNFVENETEKPRPEIGETPIWNRKPDAVQEEVARLDRSPLEIVKAEQPKRKTEERDLPKVDLPDLPNKPDEAVAVPRQENRPEPDPTRKQAARPMKVDDPQALARPDLSLPKPSKIRSATDRTGDTPRPNVDRRARNGSVDRVRTKFDPQRTQIAALDLRRPNSLPKRGPIDDRPRRRTGPAPFIAVDEGVGTPTANPETGSVSGSRSPSRDPRATTRSPDGAAIGSIERFRPTKRATAPGPRITGSPALRIGAPVAIPLPGPKLNIGRRGVASIRRRSVTRLPATFQSRDREKRKEIVKKFGGTEESERAVELSLKWLADNQHPDGYWNASGFGSGKVKIRPEIKVDDPNRAVEENDADRHFTGLRADTGVTGLAVLAFLAAGYTPDDGEYAATLSRAVNWLARQQRSDGFLGGNAKYYARHYCHAMATYALAETYAISLSDGIGGDRRLKAPVTKAVGYILKMQSSSDGGWRYRKGLKSDMSMFGWQLMALKTAEISGIAVPKSSKDGMIKFLKNRSLGKRKGLAAYREGEQPSRVMTAEALFCKQMLGINRDNPASQEAVEYLLDNLPKRSELNLYYWYYGTLAMFQYGGDSWKQWNPAFRDALRDEQVQSGPNIGSWDPKGPWGPYGGRVYATAVSTLCLQVYTRYLRLYGTDGALDD